MSTARVVLGAALILFCEQKLFSHSFSGRIFSLDIYDFLSTKNGGIKA